MPSKKNPKKSDTERATPSRKKSGKTPRAIRLDLNKFPELLEAIDRASENGDALLIYPIRLKDEAPEEREKRLEAKKALTLRAFQMAYESHRRRKAS